MSALVLVAPTLATTEYATLPELPFGAEEGRHVAALYPRSSLVTARAATPAAFREQAPRHEVVHVATHAVVNEHYPLLSAIPLTPTGPEAADGTLYAREIYQMHFARTRLVVLAVCDSGRGRLSRSEGPDSLDLTLPPSKSVRLFRGGQDTVAENKKTGQGAPGISVFEAVYEDGVLKPLQDRGLPEHHRFSVRVQKLGESRTADALEAWHRVHAGLSDEDIAEVEEIALDRSRFLRRRPE